MSRGSSLPFEADMNERTPIPPFLHRDSSSLSAVFAGGPRGAPSDLGSSFSDYSEVTLLYAANHLYGIRARHKLRDVRVFIKAVLHLHHLDAVTRIRHEWYCQTLISDLPNVGKPHAMEPCNNGHGLMLVFFDGGEQFSYEYFERDIAQVDMLTANLSAHEPRPLDVGTFLSFAIDIATILSSLHAKGITHGNISPFSLGVDLEHTGMIYDMTCSSQLEHEDTSHGHITAQHLPFISPEASGRINRSTDYRSDFYSLGATFYFLLTARCPFMSENAPELIYKHIAQLAIEPHIISGSIPPVISAIVMKLLAKTPEDRYQTAAGLLSDLVMLKDWNHSDLMTTDFVLGHADSASQFTIPQRLFGRDADVQRLLSCFEAVKEGGANVVIVKGHSGTGKSSLVNEIHRPVMKASSFYASGKFDQYKRGLPFFCLLQVASELVRQVIAQPEGQLESWKALIMEALGLDALSMFEVLPELYSLFGREVRLPDLADLGPAGREQRFIGVFLRFLLVFGRRGSPLVLFLDDVQWSSSNELNLLAQIAIAATTDQQHSLSLFIAYRDNEVLEGHHALQMLQTIEAEKVPIFVLEIGNMSYAAVREMVSATLKLPVDTDNPELETLVKLVVAQTDGNAFFVGQLLKDLHARGRLFFDFDTKQWRFHLGAIMQEELPVNVVDLLVRQIRNLGTRTTRILQLAASIGSNRFSLLLLSVVSRQRVAETSKDLWDALQAGLVVPVNSMYKRPLALADFGGEAADSDDSMDAVFRFLHDRVQQAAYQLLPDADRPQTHLDIGMRLHEHFSAKDDVDANIFEIVNQINRGLSVLQEEQKTFVIELNMRAGQRALHSTAFEAALAYLEICKKLVPLSWWEDNTAQMLNIQLAYVDAMYASHDYERAVEALRDISTKVHGNSRRARILHRLVNVYMGLDQLQPAIDVGVEALQLLGVHVPMSGAKASAMLKEMSPRLDLSLEKIDKIADMPECTQPDVLLTQTLMAAVLLPIYLSRPELLQCLCAIALDLTLKDGTIAESAAYPILMYGVTITFAEMSAKTRAQGYHFGQASVKVVDRSTAIAVSPIAPKVYKVFSSHISWWNEPTRACLVYFNSAISTGLQTFDVEYTCYAWTESCTYAFWAGEPLTSVVKRMSTYMPLVLRYKQRAGIWYMAIQLQAYVNYSSETADCFEIEGDHFSTKNEMEALLETNSHPQIFALYLYKLMTATYFHAPLATALEQSSEMEKYAHGTQGVCYIAKWSFLLCSCLVRWYKSLSPTLLALFDSHLSRLRHYNTGISSTFQHQLLFIEAELLRHEGRDLDALEKWESAYEAALEVGNVHEAAHIAERLWRWLEVKNKKIALRHLYNAYDGFRVAGFRAKARHLESLYPDLFTADTRERAVDHLEPFRHVNMQYNRDGTLGKVDPEALSVDQVDPSERSLNESKSSVRNRPAVLARPSNAESSNLSAPEGQNSGSTQSQLSKRITHSTQTRSTKVSEPGSDPHRRPADMAEFDFDVALRASVLIADVLQVSEVLTRLVESVLTNAGADYGALLLVDHGSLYLEARGQGMAGSSKVDIIEHEPLQLHSAIVPSSLVNYVARLREATVLGTGQDHRSFQAKFGQDPYFKGRRLRSIMCMPIQTNVKLIGILYLENSFTAYAFGPRRVELLNFLASQAAIAIEKARLYSDLEVAKDAAQASNRMKSEFLSTISHEIRTPFNAVLGMSGFLLDTPLTPMQTDYVETIRNSSKELLRVIDDILDFSKMEHGTFELHKEEFSLRECIEGALQITAERAASKKLELAYFNDHLDFPDVLLNDATRFRQVVINLLGNSIKFTEKGSVTCMSNATLLREQSAQGLALYRVQVSVCDTGIGIAEEDHKKLFKLFSQIDSSLQRAYSGTGLGLAISEKLVHLMDGQIWCESTVGEGSTFHFTIVTEVKADIKPQPHPATQRLTGKRALILDDSEVAMRALSESLEWLGMQVTKTSDIEAFREAIQQPSGTYQVALVDLHYGLAESMLTILTKHDPLCKVLRLSRFGDRQEFGGHLFLIKPVKRRRLAKVVAELLYPQVRVATTQPIHQDKLNPVNMGAWHPLRILLAEDNLINARVAMQHLKRMGYGDTVHVKDGELAVQEENANAYDVILMDIQMPRLDGYGATKIIREKYAASGKQVPTIIALTANAMKGDRERAIEAGMHGYCAKPIIADVLAASLLACQRILN
ncbi:hypothetical protein BCR37DRAFT_378707 [Protomyces lactucae-debilis]|uniref:histidine kinase n=1 Tax=Protomyces lactucae-debilis TaxID=2754530 RepID=A0A1Y2FIF5_PROLT|nr:uncharacterized protein BCR37DRAFT_378707 [Protomyces lactucae-debilis]ORY83742.1 hypothetical protein BCR37DRAFT_378707 [Protomyces lactucae-debilis]